jgi:nucleoside-diphosphate-sugar epimerase
VKEPARILVTGASGFLGRHLVRLLRRRHRVIAIDRRTRADAEEAGHRTVEWYQIDLSDADAVHETCAEIRSGGTVDVAVHLAAYYDFSGEEHPEYERTNIRATRLLLDACRGLGLRRFVFASSVAACPFSKPGQPITESSPPEGDHIYARTKKAGESMLAEYVDDFPSVIVRFAAMFSDWCEYPPLQVFLDTWLSTRWNARILGGRGEAAIPYLHIREATIFMHHLLGQLDRLEPGEVVIAGVDGAVSHRQLFDAASAFYFGAERRPLLMPRPLCRPGMWLRDVIGRALGSRPFERPWMADYIDRAMEIDSGRSRRRLEWTPSPRLELPARLPFLIENLKTSPLEWQRRNRAAMDHLSLQPSFRVYRLLMKYQSEIDDSLTTELERERDAGDLERRTGLSYDTLLWDHRDALRTLIDAVRSGERQAFRGYCSDLAARRIEQGVPADEVVRILRAVDHACLKVLRQDREAAELFTALRDYLSMNVEFGVDQVLETFEEAEVFGSS